MAKRTAKRATKKMSFNERVRSVIRGSAETKEKVVNVFTNSPINGSGLSTLVTPVQGITQPNLLDVLEIKQGVEQEEREGNKIENCKLTCRGFIHSNVYTDTTNSSIMPYEVHLVFYKQKKSIDNSNTDLKILPNNNTGHIDGTLMNSVYPYNKDKYIIRKVRVFKLRPLNSSQPVGGGAFVNSQNSNAPMFHRFHETISIHKDLKYNDQSNVPANDWVGVSAFVINGDGTVLDPRQIRATITMDAVLRYKDL